MGQADFARQLENFVRSCGLRGRVREKSAHKGQKCKEADGLAFQQFAHRAAQRGRVRGDLDAGGFERGDLGGGIAFPA